MREQENEKFAGMRLTEKLDEHYIARQDRVNGKIIGNQMCLDKLGELEDAEEQGLLRRLKAKVGDLVYFPIYDYHNSAIITAIRIEENGVFFDWAQYEAGADGPEIWDEGSFSLEDIGETAFLTREDAESALAEKGGAV